MGELLARFLQYMDSLDSGNVHMRTAYQGGIRKLISFLQEEGIGELQDVDHIIVMNYIASLRKRPGASGRMENFMIARKLSSLRSFYRHLNEYVGITQSLFLYFKTPKHVKRIPEFLFCDRMDTFLDSFDLDTPDGLRGCAMFELMCACGLRVSEAASLRLYDIDLHNHILTIHGKGDKQRIVPFYALAEGLLEHYLQEARPQWMKEEHDIVLLSQRGKGLTTRGIQYRMQLTADTCSLSVHVHPHMFRHSSTTHLLDSGADLCVVRELLGHASLSTTQVYAHMIQEQLKKTYTHVHPRTQEK